MTSPTPSSVSRCSIRSAKRARAGAREGQAAIGERAEEPGPEALGFRGAGGDAQHHRWPEAIDPIHEATRARMPARASAVRVDGNSDDHYFRRFRAEKIRWSSK